MSVEQIFAAVLTGGVISAILSYLAARRANKTTYMESVAETLSEFNDRLKTELKEVRIELDTERKRRRSEVEDLSEQLAAERRKTRALEERIASLESR